MPPRAIWKGSISFGLVNIPVGLYPAESPDEELHFHFLDRRGLAPIHNRRVNSETGREVPWEETVRGYEFEKGKFVVVSDEDLQSANPEATQTVEIVGFVDLAAISPLLFDKPYYLAPEKRAAKSYALLRETLQQTGKVGIAKVVIRTRQHLAAVMPAGDAIVLELLRFARELRDPAGLEVPAGKQGVTGAELKMAEKLVASMAMDWDPASYHDDYREDLMKLIQQRIDAGQLEAGAEAGAPKPARRTGQVVDLMSLLKRSVAGGKPAGRRPQPEARPEARRAAAKAGGGRPGARQASQASHSSHSSPPARTGRAGRSRRKRSA